MPRINLTIDEHEAIRPVLEAHRQAAALRAERIRTLVAVRQCFEGYTDEHSWTPSQVFDMLSQVERDL